MSAWRSSPPPPAPGSWRVMVGLALARGAASDSAVWCACRWPFRGGVDVAAKAVLRACLRRLPDTVASTQRVNSKTKRNHQPPASQHHPPTPSPVMRMHTSLPHVTRTTLSPSRPARTTGTTGDEKQRLAVLISTPGVLLPSYLALEQPHPRHHQTHPGTGTPAASTQDGQQARAPAAGGHSTWPLTVWAGKGLPRGASVAQDLPATPNKHPAPMSATAHPHPGSPW